MSAPPGPSPLATPRLLLALLTDRLGLLSSARAYGDVARLRIGPKTLYVPTEPDGAKYVLVDNAANYTKGIGLIQAKRALGDGLLTSDGPAWREQRRVVAPSFTGSRIAGQIEVIAEEGAALVDRLRARAGTGTVDVTAELTDLTLGVLGRTLMDTDLTGSSAIGQAFEAVQDQAMFEMVTLSAVPTWLPLARQRRFRRARRQLEEVVEGLVARRRESGADDGDLVARLLASAEAEDDPAVGRRRLRDELVTLLLAGHETTASTLSWTLHLIAGRPDVRRWLRAEARETLGDALPRHEDLGRLSYTTMVVQEAMRLFPPVWLLPRLSREADEIAGFRVPAGADVLVCPYALHRHPAHWPDPDRFDPDRFAPEATADRPRHAYIPFGGGPHFCVGSNLGMAEAVLVTALISRDLELHAVPGRPPVPEPMLSLRVRGGLRMTVQKAEEDP